jgi:mannose-6-phosphate isomerase
MSRVAELVQGRYVDKPWGYEIIWAETEHYVGKLLHIEQDQQLSYQYHERKDETIHVLSGRVLLEVAEANGPRRQVELSAGQTFHIPPGVRHRMTGTETCEIMEVSTPELDDVIRLEDRYGRVGK